MTHLLDQWLSAQLDTRKAQHRYRTRWLNSFPSPAEPAWHEGSAVDFSGNDYLGLSKAPQVCEALSEGAKRYGASATASPLVGGYFDVHQRLEALLAEWTQRPAALLFPTGFQANLGVLDALTHRASHCFHDRLNHASLLDGTRLSGAKSERYHHLDMIHLDKRMTAVSARQSVLQKVVISDAVFSMEGDIAPLPELAAVARQHAAWLVIDDAHGVGVLGKDGGGACVEASLSHEDVPIMIGTLSKALGGQGAFVAGSQALIDTLVQLARPYVFSTGLAPAQACAAEAAVHLCRDEPERRHQLHDVIHYFRAAAEAESLPLLPSRTPIQAIVTGDETRTLAIAESLKAQQLYVGAIRPPTVPIGKSRLRITLNATHTRQQIDRLVDSLAKEIQEH
ncbi:8-amino-7-oxononanoate synthase [Cernens ardua]|uniref:8-amino-7-oxononanoate synthase n=1 Tax=Cernens ardua TaxID=3402176 RepID=UPI003F979A6D